MAELPLPAALAVPAALLATTLKLTVPLAAGVKVMLPVPAPAVTVPARDGPGEAVARLGRTTEAV